MRILLAQNSLYFPAYGGGEKSNRLLMEALAARAHQVSVVSRVQRLGPAGHETLARELSERGVLFRTIADAVTFDLNGVDVRVLSLDSHWRAFFAAEVAEFDPDVILTSTDDPAQLLFELALKSSRARVVYLVRATIAVPFGPIAPSLAPNEPRGLAMPMPWWGSVNTWPDTAAGGVDSTQCTFPSRSWNQAVRTLWAASITAT